MTFPFDSEIHISKIFLDLENARHNPVSGEDDAIDALCRNEPILSIAKDIAVHGLNPMDRVGVTVLREGKNAQDTTFVALEGNRRICALKLLFDPERAPAHQRAAFKAASKDWGGIGEISVVVFPTKESADLWLKRFHMGEDKGLGRRPWNPEGQARKFGHKKNKLALAILDYCEENKIISETDRKNKVTTLQRVLGNKNVKTSLGIFVDDAGDVCRTVSKANFNKNLKRLVSDLLSGKLNSRLNSDGLNKYATGASQKLGTQNSVKPVLVANDVAPSGKPGGGKNPVKSPTIVKDEKIHNLLHDAGIDKLIWLYRSIHQVSIEKHTPMVAVGVWSFFETLTKNAGRKDGTSFTNFCSKAFLKKLNLEKSKTPIATALTRISVGGNNTKHDEEAAIFNAKQLANDMKTLNRLTIALLKKIIEEKK